jgi:hypothetical protein
MPTVLPVGRWGPQTYVRRLALDIDFFVVHTEPREQLFGLIHVLWHLVILWKYITDQVQKLLVAVV